MSMHDTAPQQHGAAATTTTRLRGRCLMLVHGAWAAAVLLTLGMFMLSLPARFDVVSTPTLVPRLGQLSVHEVDALAQLGLSVRMYAWYEVFWTVAPVLVFGAVASIIVWRKSNDWLALLVALVLLMVACIAPPAMRALVARDPTWRMPVAVVQSLGLTLFFYLCCVFPTGQFVPYRMRWLAVIWTGYTLTRVIVPALDQPFYLTTARTGTDLYALMWLMVWFTAGFTAQLYRYRQVSTPMEQQQTKWVVSGFAAMLVILALAGVLLQVVPWLKQPGAGVLFYTLLVVPVAACGLTLLPLSFGFAILHSRLWDIDILINRTLVYSTLTVLLASIYALSVVLLQTVLRTLTNQTSPLTVVVSTLAVAVLFQPLRRRIQAIIDRRFYRRKYDAQKTVQGFSARLREETDFAHLSNDLIAVIQETLQPAHVSLWLRDGGVRSAEQRSATRASREVS